MFLSTVYIYIYIWSSQFYRIYIIVSIYSISAAIFDGNLENLRESTLSGCVRESSIISKNRLPFEGMIQTRGGKLEILSRDEYVLKSSFFLLNFQNSNFEEEFAKVREE